LFNKFFLIEQSNGCSYFQGHVMTVIIYQQIGIITS